MFVDVQFIELHKQLKRVIIIRDDGEKFGLSQNTTQWTSIIIVLVFRLLFVINRIVLSCAQLYSPGIYLVTNHSSLYYWSSWWHVCSEEVQGPVLDTAGTH